MFVFIIKDIMQQKNISTEELSKKARVSVNYITDLMENAIHDTRMGKLLQVAEALEVKLEDTYFSIQQIEELRSILDRSIEKNGIMHRETKRISKLLDILINLNNSMLYK